MHARSTPKPANDHSGAAAAGHRGGVQAESAGSLDHDVLTAPHPELLQALGHHLRESAVGARCGGIAHGVGHLVEELARADVVVGGEGPVEVWRGGGGRADVAA